MVEEYVLPTSVKECLGLLDKFNGAGRIIAGGTDLVLQQENKEIDPAYLVDISRIEELKSITKNNGEICLGGGVTHAEAAASPLIMENAEVLADASRSIGSPQIRNIATLAGNLVNAQPAADAAVALTALKAEVDVVSKAKKSCETVEDLYLGVGKSKLDSSKEILTAIRFKPVKDNRGSAFYRISPRKSLSLPVLNAGIVIEVEDELITAASIVLGPVADRPFRAKTAEKMLQGTKINDSYGINQAAEAAGDESSPRDSLLRGSSEYRQELIKVVVRRGCNQAIKSTIQK